MYLDNLAAPREGGWMWNQWLRFHQVFIGELVGISVMRAASRSWLRLRFRELPLRGLQVHRSTQLLPLFSLRVGGPELDDVLCMRFIGSRIVNLGGGVLVMMKNQLLRSRVFELMVCL